MEKLFNHGLHGWTRIIKEFCRHPAHLSVMIRVIRVQMPWEFFLCFLCASVVNGCQDYASGLFNSQPKLAGNKKYKFLKDCILICCAIDMNLYVLNRFDRYWTGGVPCCISQKRRVRTESDTRKKDSESGDEIANSD